MESGGIGGEEPKRLASMGTHSVLHFIVVCRQQPFLLLPGKGEGVMRCRFW